MQIYYGLLCNLLCNFTALYEGSHEQTRTLSECLGTYSSRTHYNLREKVIKKYRKLHVGHTHNSFSSSKVLKLAASSRKRFAIIKHNLEKLNPAFKRDKFPWVLIRPIIK